MSTTTVAREMEGPQQRPRPNLATWFGDDSRGTILVSLLALLVYAVARTVAYAKTKPLWIDEVFTQAVSQQPTIEAIWKALRSGVDGQPPLFYLLERSVAALTANEHVGYRLLSILGFACTMIFLYVFVKTRNGRSSGLICASLLLMTSLFTYYAAEARPYSLWTACLAAAMVCYQRAKSAAWVAGMFFSLLLASALHYYTVLALTPFFLAELVESYEGKQVRIGVWGAMIASLTPIALCLPLIMEMRRQWGAHFWANAFPHTFGTTYATLIGAGSPWSTAVGLGAAAAVLGSLAAKKFAGEGSREGLGRIPSSERALVLGLILLPLVGYAAAKLTNGPVVDRYFLPAILGLAAGLAYLLRGLDRKWFALAGIFAFVAIGTQERGFWLIHRDMPAERVKSVVGLADVVGHEELPIVVSSLSSYVEFAHYAPESFRPRLVGLADPEGAVVYSRTDTIDRLILALRSYLPLAVYDYGSFAAEHRTFLLYSDSEGGDWWPERLAHEGHQVEYLAGHRRQVMYLVELKAHITK